MAELDATEIIQTIATAKKRTPVKAMISGRNLRELSVPEGIEAFMEVHTGTLFGNWPVVKAFLNEHQNEITQTHIESNATNSAVPLLDAREVNARIEPGAIIRDQVVIGDHAVVMMGALINIGAEVGADSMIDMGAVLGGRAIVGQHCHIGAGAVLAGVIEPASAQPVRVDDNVLIGANAVVIEGIHVGANAVVGAGAVVTQDVPANSVVAGVPAKVIKVKDAKTKSKTGLQDSLRDL